LLLLLLCFIGAGFLYSSFYGLISEESSRRWSNSLSMRISNRSSRRRRVARTSIPMSISRCPVAPNWSRRRALTRTRYESSWEE
jgi:hypothetical protein